MVLWVAAFPMCVNFSPLLSVHMTVNLGPCFLDLSNSIRTQLNLEGTQRSLCGGCFVTETRGAGGAGRIQP